MRIKNLFTLLVFMSQKKFENIKFELDNFGDRNCLFEYLGSKSFLF